MGIRNWLNTFLNGTAADDILSDDAFHERVRIEEERIGAHRAGVLAVEATTITEHLMLAKTPASRDLVDLLAVTHLLLNRYDYRPLRPLARLRGYTETHAAFVEYFQQTALEGYFWSEHLLHATTALHHHAMEHASLEWLIEWRPAEPALHGAKTALFRQAKISTQTHILQQLAERETALLEEGAAVQNAPDYTAGTLWHSVTDTRAMRLCTEDVWIRHPALPKDYVTAVQGKSPMAQRAFLLDKHEHIAAICRRVEEEDTARAAAASGDTPITNTKRFSLYGAEADAGDIQP